MTEGSKLENVIDGQLPSEIAVEYGGFLITQGMQEHPLMASAPTVRQPYVVVCDGDRFAVYDLTNLDSVTELKDWLDGLDLAEDIEAVSITENGTEGVEIRAEEYGEVESNPANSERTNCGTEEELAETVVRVKMLERKKAKQLEEMSSLFEDEVKGVSLRRLGETEYRLRQAKGKVNRLEYKYRHNLGEGQ